MSDGSSSYLFSLLPEDLLIDEILLKLPVSSLLRLRCVSSYFHNLITSPRFVRMHHNSSMINNNLLLTTCRCIRPFINPTNGQPSIKEEFQHFSCNFSSVDDPSIPEVVQMSCPFEAAGIQGSCNGLLFLHGITRDQNKNRGYIWNPCTREYKELHAPSVSVIEEDNDHQHLSGGGRIDVTSGFCGFGYDRTNDEYKILYYENRVGNVIHSQENLASVTEFKLYTLGSDTWKSISDNPYKSLFFGDLWRKKGGLLVNGALHWIMSSTATSSWARDSKIISFDIEKEEFGEVQKPPPYYSSTRSSSLLVELQEEYDYGQLQVLQECLCLCQPNIQQTIDIWMLKDYTVKDSWTRLFTIAAPTVLLLEIRYLKSLRFSEKGEILVLRDRRKQLIMYDPVNHNQSRICDEPKWVHEVIYKESLVSLGSGTCTI